MRASLADLWDPAPSSIFVAGDPPVYLRHALLPGSPKATAVRLTMRGEIRLKKWRPFRAEEVIDHQRGFVWRAKISGALSGSDSLVDGAGSARWNLLGVLPVMRASGPDVTRSAIGRWLLESCWLPTMLRPDDGASWEGPSVTLSRFGETGRIDMRFSSGGGLQEFRMDRWGNPGGGAFAYHPFGGLVEEERRFGGFVIPSRLRVGWHFGTPAWDEGEFFRVTVEDARFR